jgi:flagellar basal-body rod protein FlgB
MDALFGIHDEALLLRSQRSELLARNLANADTPNYLARDIDFSAALEAARDGGAGLQLTSPLHQDGGGEAPGGGDLLYRMPMQSAVDGNTVDTDIERSEFTRNSLAYEASLRFLSGRVSGLLSAIRGE